MSSVGSLSDKSLLLSTVQMDDSQQHPSYHVSEAIVNYIDFILKLLNV